MSVQYDDIYFNQSRVPGEVRMSKDGLGWRASQKAVAGSNTRVSQPFLLPASELLSASWSRGAHNFMLQIHTRSGDVVSLDGFDPDEFQSLQRSLSSNLDLQLEHKEYSLRGWNWGEAEFASNELVFNVASKPDFEIPYSSIASTNVVGKSEVAVELDLPAQSERTSYGDELVELRFYVPSAVAEGTTFGSKTGEAGQGSDEDEAGDDETNAIEVVNSAQQFHDQLQERANIGSVSGSEIAQFSEVLFTTPRGRYDVMFFKETFRLHGKTYDYKVPYEHVKRIFVLPKLDELHDLVVVQLVPPLRQGQTRYPFLVMQFGKDDLMEIELNVTDEEFEEYYKERKIEKTYNASSTSTVSSLFKGLSDRGIITPPATFKSTRNLPAVSALLRAAEAVLYPLDKGLLIVTKTPMYIQYSLISGVRFSRLATGNRSFDLMLTLLKTDALPSEVALTSVSKEEQPVLEHFFESKNLRIKNDATEGRKQRGGGKFDDPDDMADDGDESDDEDFDASPSEDDDDASGNSDASGDGSDDDSDGSEDVSEVDDDEEGFSDEEDSKRRREVNTGDSKIGAKKDRKRVKK